MGREKVIKGLESLYARLLDVAMQDSIIMLDVSMVANAIDLLKEQEAVEPITEHKLFLCPVCKNTLFREQKFCHECGKRIEWEGR